MIIEALEHKIDIESVNCLWPDYKNLESEFRNYSGTNIKHANQILDQILEREEKECLEALFFGDNGWYRRIDGNGMILLKLAAINLGITNDIFAFDSQKEEKILERVERIPEDLQLLVMRCYLKQKLITYLTLCNYLQNIKKDDKMVLTLYREINTPYDYDNTSYIHTGLESWTTSIDSAYKFARKNGYVIEKEYPISQIFISPRSSFKNIKNRKLRNNGFYVRREHEIIVENNLNIYEYKEHQIYLVSDREVV